MNLTVIFLSLLSSLLITLDDPGIDYNPRLLHKEINTIFGDGDYRMTEIRINDFKNENLRVNGKFYNIRNADGEILTAFIGRVNSCRAGGCSSHNSTPDLQSEYFDYFILFDSLKAVKLVRIYNYEATHGQEVTVKKWLDQFSGFNGEIPLRTGKEIDTISGATISVNALVADVIEKTMILKNLD